MNQIIKYGSISQIPLYNCSELTSDEWSERDGIPRPIAGISSIIYGIIMNIMYLPILAVMFEKDNYRMSCFKIMILLALYDMLAIWVNSVSTGYLAYHGAVYCSFPTLTYISGMLALASWCGSCMIATILIINRLLDLTTTLLIDKLFDGNRTLIVLSILIIYSIYFVLFTPPVLFTSKYYAWFLDPLIFPNKSLEYVNIPHIFNNILVVAITCIFYMTLCCILRLKVQNIGDNDNARKLSKQIFLQSALICSFNQVGSFIYVIFNFVQVPIWIIVTGHVMWQVTHGIPVVIYLTLNTTIRTGVMRKLGINCTTPRVEDSMMVTTAVQATTVVVEEQ